MGLAERQLVASEGDSRSLALRLGRDPWRISLGALFFALAWVSWGRIESPIIDFGREVEIPSRLLSGQVLYGDVGTYYGPLAYYANAVLLGAFGHHLGVFFALGLVLAAIETVLVYQLARRFLNSQWAVLCSAYVLIYCVFHPGIFNFMTPYSYGAVYANVLCLVSLYFLDRHALTHRSIWIAVAGLACVLAAIAKQEYGAASLAGLCAGIAARSTTTLKTRVRDALLVTIGVGACVVFVVAVFAAYAGWPAVLDSLVPTSKLGTLTRSSFFEVSWGRTLKEWGDSLGVFLVGSLFIVTAMSAVAGASKVFRRHTGQPFRALAETAAAVIVAWFLWIIVRALLVSLARWVGIAIPGVIAKGLLSDLAIQPLRKFSWFIPVVAMWIAVRSRQLAAERHGALLFGLAAFALVLNARWLFFVGFYGLYAPAVALLFFVALHRISSRMKVQRFVQRYLVVCLVIGAALTIARHRGLDHPVSSIYGTFSTGDPNVARAFNQAIGAILERKSTSVLVIPEGSLINFLTATHSPSYSTTFLPSVLATPEEESEFVRSTEKRSPELIVYVHRFLVGSGPGSWAFPEWGYETYGEFNPIVDSWIKNEHRLIGVFPEAGSPIISMYSRRG